MWRARVASGSATIQLHHVPGHDPGLPLVVTRASVPCAADWCQRSERVAGIARRQQRTRFHATPPEQTLEEMKSRCGKRRSPATRHGGRAAHRRKEQKRAKRQEQKSSSRPSPVKVPVRPRPTGPADTASSGEGRGMKISSGNQRKSEESGTATRWRHSGVPSAKLVAESSVTERPGAKGALVG
jgi:hypothetical protein